ncbi:hypothetical protein JG687_00015803 [Phytophthora cactorum]|uniref:Uncharacterized protein n=1 Tax=Phytophthora cactorum TaxID=29920 RepID=A0A8T1TVA7_9STRA|nr:hypothetical protein JG687_00015803 [Phytophthora cactorum]
MECARQNSDCGLEVASKVSALAMAVLGTATFGVIGEMVKLGKKLTWAVKCTNQLLLVMRGIIRYVRNVKTEDPQTSQQKLLLMLYQTNNVVTDLPMVIYACMGKNIPSTLRLTQIVLATAQWMLLQALAYDDDIISTWARFRAFMKGANFTEAAEEITEGEIASLETAMQQNSSCAVKSGKSDNGTSLDEKAAAYKWIDTGLSTISASMIDPTDIATLLSEYIQTICGPTQFMGEIDDGTEDATLGLNTLQRAFKGSSSSWTKVGDGAVIINFTSSDTKDVTVNIMSGGDKIEEVDVKARGTAQWTSNITFLGGKTLYLDRWRPGFLGFPGTGGGSLVLWVPRASQGGHLELEVKINVS